MLTPHRPDPDRGRADDGAAVPPALERLRAELAETLARLEDAVDEVADRGRDDDEGGGPRNA